MIDIIKLLWKWIFWILVLFIIGAVILAFRIFVIDKDYNGKSSNGSGTLSSSSKSNSKSVSSSDGSVSGGDNGSVTDTVNSNDPSGANSADSNSSLSSKAKDKLSSAGEKVINGAKAIGNATVRGYKEDEEVYTYNVYNFDEAFLMYEGTQNDMGVKNVLEHLISNSEGDFYARTSVTAVNFGNNAKIEYNGDVKEYQNEIRNLENTVSGGMYDISFGYGGFHTYVNEIIITKK